MKKIVFFAFVSMFAFCGVSYAAVAAAAERYIIFFAETPDIAQAVSEKIYFSKRFCIAVPFETKGALPENLEELVSYGKIEPAASFNPEPALPILASVYSSASHNRGDFGQYISANFEAFETGANRERFGVLLKSGDISHNILYYFAGIKLPWINAANMGLRGGGVYLIDGVTVFSLHRDFPAAQKDVMKWLQSKKDVFIPVLLTKKHLTNAEFMSYIIDLFDSSAYIKPASPLFVCQNKQSLIEDKNDAEFKQVDVKSSVMRKLYAAASLISDYGQTGGFNAQFYDNAVSELVYLCSYSALKSVASGKTEGLRMFDAAYANIFRLLGTTVPNDENSVSDKSGIYKGSEDVFQTAISAGNNSVSITNDGIVKEAEISAKDGFTNIKLVFESGQWNEKAAFVDVYIDMNNFDNAGATAMLGDLNGFLSPDSAWEYALRIDASKALLYRYSSDNPVLISEFAVTDSSVSVPQKLMRGNPVNWGYQIITVSKDGDTLKIADFLNPSSQPKSDFLNQKPFQIPAIRLKAFQASY
ncbi:MAG: hypothetical protein LBQ47_07125 [Endomicrobium sp.]|nr:hypothetical protein [Endomicrobium sp.]